MLKYTNQLTSKKNPVRPLELLANTSEYISQTSLCHLSSLAGRSLTATLNDALSARGFDLVVNRISQQIQQLVPLPGLLCKNAGGSRRHLTRQLQRA